MRVVILHCAIFIALTSYVGCLKRPEDKENGVSPDFDSPMDPFGTCADGKWCGEQGDLLGGMSDEEMFLGHYYPTTRQMYTEMSDLEDGDHGRKSTDAIFDVAFQLLDNANRMLSKLKRLKKDLDQIAQKSHSPFNAAQKSLFHLKTKLDEEVFSVTDEFEVLDGVPSHPYPDDALEKLQGASEALDMIKQKSNNFAKIVLGKAKSIKEKSNINPKIKEFAHQIWKMVLKLEKDLADLTARIENYLEAERLPKVQAHLFMQEASDLKNILLERVAPELQKFQPFAKPSKYSPGSEATVEECKDILLKVVQKFNDLDRKMILALGAQLKGPKQTYQGSSHIHSKVKRAINMEATQVQAKEKVFSAEKVINFLAWASVVISAVVAASVGTAVILAYSRKRGLSMLPVTVYDN